MSRLLLQVKHLRVYSPVILQRGMETVRHERQLRRKRRRWTLKQKSDFRIFPIFGVPQIPPAVLIDSESATRFWVTETATAAPFLFGVSASSGLE